MRKDRILGDLAMIGLVLGTAITLGLYPPIRLGVRRLRRWIEGRASVSAEVHGDVPSLPRGIR